MKYGERHKKREGRAAMMLFGRYKVTAKEEWKV
jgi:hypothetical protein